MGATIRLGFISLVDGLLLTALEREYILSFAYRGTVKPFYTPYPTLKL